MELGFHLTMSRFCDMIRAKEVFPVLAAQEKRYTYADVLTWDENERIELIYGEPFMMSPPTRKHQKIAGKLYLQIGNYLTGKKCEVYPAPFGVRLFEGEGDQPYNVDTLVEPDITVVCDPDKLDDAGCKGAPDFIIEVLSPSTQRHDRHIKFEIYQQAGVREYWIVDPEACIVQVHTLEEGKYHSPVAYNAKSVVPVGIFEDCKIDLSSVFD